MKDDFGHIAERYDSEFTDTAVGKLQRNRVWHFLQKDLDKPPQNILEINCGTGKDAIHLVQLGHKVLATDISPNMVKIAMRNADEANVGVEVCALDVNRFQEFNRRDFDVIFSNFGGLNCLSPQEMKVFAQNCNQKLMDSGRFTAVIMGRKCWWERLYFWWKKKPDQAKRRQSKEAVMAQVEDKHVPTWYYSPKEFTQFFLNDFDVIRTRPVGLFVPPSYLNPAFTKRKWLLGFLGAMERLSPNFLSNAADHYYITFRKKS